MKKLIALLLMMALMLSFTACGSDEPDDVRGNLETQETNDTENTAEDEDVPLSMGQANGNVYESEFIGIGFNLPENWIFYTDDQINELNNLASDMVDEDIAEVIAEATIIYDMFAQDATTGSSVNINLEKLDPINVATTTAKQYVDVAISGVEQTLQSMGYANIVANATTVTLAGEECPAIDIVASAEQVTLYETVVCKKVGSYMVNITVGTANTDERTSILDMFYSLD